MQCKLFFYSLTCALTLNLCANESLVKLRENDFILGFYSSEGTGNLDRNFKLQKNIGINYVHTYATPFSDDARSRAYCRRFADTAQKYGLKVLFNLRGRKFADKDDGIQQMMDMIRDFHNHPAIGMWYMADEPPARQFPFFTKLTDELHRMTPTIPCTIVEMWETNWWKMRNFCDVVMADYYPVRGQPFPEVRLNSYAQFMRTATHLVGPKSNRPIPAIAVMQTMDCGEFPSLIKPEHKHGVRFPNMPEMRFMGICPIAYGARGLFFFSYYRARLDNPKNRSWFNTCFVPFLKEVKDVTDLLHPAWHVTAEAPKLEESHQIIASYWKRKTGNYLILINNTSKTRDLMVTLGEQKGFPKDGNLMPLFQTRTTKAVLANGMLTMNQLKPWETFIWKLITPR